MRDLIEEIERLQKVAEDYKALKTAYDAQEKLIEELREAHRRQGIELSLARNDYDFRGARVTFLERYTDEQAHKILELEWQLHNMEEPINSEEE